MDGTLPASTFLIEIRLTRTKWRIKRNTEEIARIFSIGGFIEKHPHVTLFGPFTLKKGVTVPHLLRAVEEAAHGFSAVPYLIAGYDMNQGLNGAVIAYRVVPTDPLIDLNDAVSSHVRKLALDVNIWDVNPDQKWYHVTIANRLDRQQGSAIYEQLTGQVPIPGKNGGMTSRFIGGIMTRIGNDPATEPSAPPRPPLIDEDGVRITVINGNYILAEYDLLRHRWFSPRGHHAAREWQQSLRQLRQESGIECTRPAYGSKHDLYVISDLHLGHTNIIKYCSRPFPHDATGEMDEMLIRNWNYTVQNGDRVYHLGDLCYGPLSKGPAEYIRKLNGSLTLIAGNHDAGPTAVRHAEQLVFDDIRFTLVHDPADAPPVAGAWVIHGHHHNNNLAHYPFINFEDRRINVSAEVIRYRPVSLTELCHIIKDHQVRPKVKSILLRQG